MNDNATHYLHNQTSIRPIEPICYNLYSTWFYHYRSIHFRLISKTENQRYFQTIWWAEQFHPTRDDIQWSWSPFCEWFLSLSCLRLLASVVCSHGSHGFTPFTRFTRRKLQFLEIRSLWKNNCTTKRKYGANKSETCSLLGSGELRGSNTPKSLFLSYWRS